MEFGNEQTEAPSPGPLPEREGFKRIRIHAPCRLHFGMFSFGHADQPQFGGVGVMVNPPAVEIEITPAAEFSVTGTHFERVYQFAKTAAHSGRLASLPHCQINVKAPTDHTGLGVGTQLGLAVAAGLRQFLALPHICTAELSAAVGRGARSSVGTYGFELGGLIVDGGKMPGVRTGELVCRMPLPEEWRFVLLRPTGEQGLAGEHEASAFARLPPVPVAVTRRLWQITHERMLPAVRSANCEQFGDAVYEFGRLAGNCFAAAQGGPFANAGIERLVTTIRHYGVTGVGQSSWGPTVFAIVAGDAQAEELASWLRGNRLCGNLELLIARASNSGAVVRG